MTNTIPEPGDPAPDFCIQDSSGKSTCVKDFRGQWLILYFYPRDNTSGCTLEAMEFTAAKKEFGKLNAEVVGISPDSCQSHVKFMVKHDLGITLLSDPDHTALEAYGAWRLKKLYGRESMGVVRSTFLIDPDGKIAHVWPKVKVKGHVETVLEKLKELQN